MKSKVVQITLVVVVAITLMTTGIVYANDDEEMIKWIQDMLAWILVRITNLQEADVQHDEQNKKLTQQIEELQAENEKQQTQIKQLQDFRDDALADIHNDLDANMNPPPRPISENATVTLTNQTIKRGGPDNAGAIGSAHDHTAILVEIFTDRFDFSLPSYQLKSSWIHFEGRDGSTIHKHATGVTLGYLFDTLGLNLDDKCLVFPDGREFCTDEEYKLLFFVNGKAIDDLREYEPMEDDRVLISYGATPEELESQMLRISNQIIVR